MKYLLLVMVLFFISSCANKNPNKVVAVKAGDEYYEVDQSAARALGNEDSNERVMCTRRSVVGSNKKRKVCTTKTQMDSDHEDARRIMKKAEHIKLKKAAQSRQN